MSGWHGAGGFLSRGFPQAFELYVVKTYKVCPENLGALPVFFSFFKKRVDF